MHTYKPSSIAYCPRNGEHEDWTVQTGLVLKMKSVSNTVLDSRDPGYA